MREIGKIVMESGNHKKIDIHDILGKDFVEDELIHSFYSKTFDLVDRYFPPVVSYALPRILQCENVGVVACLSINDQTEQTLHYWFGRKDSPYIASGSARVATRCSECPDSCSGICPVIIHDNPQFISIPYHVQSYPHSVYVRGHIILNGLKNLIINEEQKQLINRAARRLHNQFRLQFHIEAGIPQPLDDDLIPICSFCKKIRDDELRWVRLEKFFYDNYDIQFTHSICPHCSQEYLKTIK